MCNAHLALLAAASFAERFGALHATFTSTLYPASDYSMRNAASRTDGYWPFVSAKQDVPISLTYGEFPLPLFTRAVDRACELAGLAGGRAGATFADIGSGSGRLVLWAACTHEWKEVHGVELLPSLHAEALRRLDSARELHALRDGLALQTERIVLSKGSFEDPTVLPWRDVDVAFAYTTAFPHDEAGVLTELTEALVPRLARGCLVCTTDYRLGEDSFELIDDLEGENDGVGSVSQVFIHRKLCEGDGAGSQVELLKARVEELSIALDERDARLSELQRQLDASRAECEELRAKGAAGAAADDDDESRESEEEFLERLRAWSDETGYLDGDDGGGGG